jgi:hypothetical protein
LQCWSGNEKHCRSELNIHRPGVVVSISAASC